MTVLRRSGDASARPERGLSDAALRRWGWVIPVLCLVVVITRQLLIAVNPALQGVDSSLAVDLLILGFPVAALAIVRLRPRNRIGWLLMAISAVWLTGGLAELYSAYGLVVAPGSLVRPDAAAVVAQVIWAPALGLIGTFLVLLFPDGHLPSPAWRPLAWLSAVTIIGLTGVVVLSPGKLANSVLPDLDNPWGIESARAALGPLLGVFAVLLPACMIGSAVALARRFRRSTGVERQQLKWLLAAGTVTACSYGVGMVASLASGALFGSGPDPAWLNVLDAVSFLTFLLMPLSIGVAVTRHRLYDIDTVISRTLAYLVLSVTLATTYASCVLLLQWTLGPLTRHSDLAVAVSTLAVAAVFRPAQARIQSTVDRRFHRRRYDGVRALDALSGRLRHEVDLESVAADVRAVVADTVDPAHFSLWLRQHPSGGDGTVTIGGHPQRRKASP